MTGAEDAVRVKTARLDRDGGTSGAVSQYDRGKPSVWLAT